MKTIIRSGTLIGERVNSLIDDPTVLLKVAVGLCVMVLTICGFSL